MSETPCAEADGYGWSGPLESWPDPESDWAGPGFTTRNEESAVVSTELDALTERLCNLCARVADLKSAIASAADRAHRAKFPGRGFTPEQLCAVLDGIGHTLQGALLADHQAAGATAGPAPDAFQTVPGDTESADWIVGRTDARVPASGAAEASTEPQWAAEG